MTLLPFRPWSIPNRPATLKKKPKAGPRDADNRRVAAMYSRMLKERGQTPQALGWTDDVRQTIRFEMLTLIGLKPGDVVLDVGCGTGDLLAWFRDENIDVTYVGMDMVPAMISHCQKRFPSERFVLGDMGSAAADIRGQLVDYVFASGIFAHRRVNPEQDMKDLIASMVRLARKGVAFNCLSDRAPNMASWSLYHACPDNVLTYCQSLGYSCTLYDAYLDGDFTIHIKKNP